MENQCMNLYFSYVRTSINTYIVVRTVAYMLSHWKICLRPERNKNNKSLESECELLYFVSHVIENPIKRQELVQISGEIFVL